MIGQKTSELADSISYRQLRLFESVGRLSSVRQGSDECNLSQPAVTQAIRKLEKQLDETLLERRASGSYLTPAGEIFHERVQSFISQFEDALVHFGVSGGRNAAATIANRISRSQVRGLIAIVEHLTFEKASQALSITQASLQRAARDLESNVRRSVYHRTAAGVMVTPNGLELGRLLKLANQEIEWGIREIWDLQGSAESQLTIGALPFGGSMLLATVLDGFATSHPSAEVRIVTEGAAEMTKRLRSGDVDLLVGLVQDTTADDLTNRILARTPYRVVCRHGHPLAGKSGIDTADLLDFDWVVGTPGSNRRQAFDMLFEGHATPHTGVATSSLPVVRHLIKNSDRLALMTSYELRMESHDFEAIDFREIDLCPAVGVTQRKGWTPTRLHRVFVDHLQAAVDEDERID